MPPAAPGGCYKLPGVKLFASGVYRDKRWTPATVKAIAANADKLGPGGLKLLVPPGVLGHEEDQEWLDRTDLPAAGWVDPRTVRAVPDPDHPGELILTGDVVNVPQAVKDRFDRNEYTRCSAEIYDDFLDDFGKSHGPALRRLAFLGGEVPQVKRLGPLPKAVPMAAVRFAEPLPPPGRAALYSFAERVVDRTQLVAAIQAALPGMSRATLEANSDDQLKEWVANLPQPTPTPPSPTGTAGMDRASMIAEMVAAGVPQADLDLLDDAALQAKYDEWKLTQAAPAAATPDAAGDVATMGDPAAMSREELIAELTAAGQDAAALDAMTDDDLRAMYTELGLGATASAPAEEAAAPAVAAMSEVARRKAVQSMTQFTAFAELQLKRMKVVAAQQRRDKVNAFCERMVREGRILPAQVADYKSLLLPLDDLRPVHKFSENGRTTTLTALDRKCREIAARGPIVRFGERVAAGTPDQTNDAAEVAKVREFAQTLSDRALEAGGYASREAFVERFSEARKKNPKITAAAITGR